MSGTSLASITDEYLARLDAAAWRLPRDRRSELVSEVREHIDAAMLERSGDEAALRTVLDHLGAPEEIARAAVEQEGLPLPGPTPDATNLRDISTVLLLMFGGFLLGAGWVLGVVLLWTSPRWRARDKLLATLVWPVGYVGVFDGADHSVLGINDHPGVHDRRPSGRLAHNLHRRRTAARVAPSRHPAGGPVRPAVDCRASAPGIPEAGRRRSTSLMKRPITGRRQRGDLP